MFGFTSTKRPVISNYRHKGKEIISGENQRETCQILFLFYFWFLITHNRFWEIHHNISYLVQETAVQAAICVLLCCATSKMMPVPVHAHAHAHAVAPASESPRACIRMKQFTGKAHLWHWSYTRSFAVFRLRQAQLCRLQAKKDSSESTHWDSVYQLPQHNIWGHCWFFFFFFF